MVADDRHVAVNEEHIVVLGLAHQKVADGSSSAVDRLTEVAAIGPLTDLLIVGDDCSIGRTIVAHQDLIGDTDSLSLLSETIHKTDTAVVVGGNEDG